MAFERAGAEVARVWHKDTALPEGIDIVGIPGGFSFGDYLRCGAIAAQSPVMRGGPCASPTRGGYVLGICNGFQVLTESGLLPGALMRNAGLKFVCKTGRTDSRNRRQRLHARLEHGRPSCAFRSRIMTATTPSTPTALRGCGAKTASPSAMLVNPNGCDATTSPACCRPTAACWA